MEQPLVLVDDQEIVAVDPTEALVGEMLADTEARNEGAATGADDPLPPPPQAVRSRQLTTANNVPLLDLQ